MITIYTGVMFSGKTAELLKTHAQYIRNGQKVLLIKPCLDNRFSDTFVVSRNGLKAEANMILDTTDKGLHLDYIRYRCLLESYKAVFIDEAQFFGEDLYFLVQALAEMKVKVYLSGLMFDCYSRVFGQLKRISLLGSWVKVQEFKIFCQSCGEKTATVSFRKSSDSNQVLVGSDEYEPRCKDCCVSERVRV
jgi:thymidine kinase